MKQKLMILVTGLLALASPMLAQGTANAPAGDPMRRGLAYLAMGIAAGLCGIGQGRATGSSAEAVARNPGAVGPIRVFLILGLVLIESLALYTFVITFVAR